MPYDVSEENTQAVVDFINAGTTKLVAEIVDDSGNFCCRTQRALFTHPQCQIELTTAVQMEKTEAPGNARDVIIALITGVPVEPTWRMHVAASATLKIEGVEDYSRYYTTTTEPFCDHSDHQCEYYTTMVLSMVVLENVLGLEADEE